MSSEITVTVVVRPWQILTVLVGRLAASLVPVGWLLRSVAATNSCNQTGKIQASGGRVLATTPLKPRGSEDVWNKSTTRGFQDPKKRKFIAVWTESTRRGSFEAAGCSLENYFCWGLSKRTFLARHKVRFTSFYYKGHLGSFGVDIIAEEDVHFANNISHQWSVSMGRYRYFVSLSFGLWGFGPGVCCHLRRCAISIGYQDTTRYAQYSHVSSSFKIADAEEIAVT